MEEKVEANKIPMHLIVIEIILAILCILMVVYIYQESQCESDEDNSSVLLISNTEIQVYNSPVTGYAGSRVKASSVKECINEIINLNSNYADNHGKYIGLTITAEGISTTDLSLSEYVTIDENTVTIPYTEDNNVEYVETTNKDMSALKTCVDSGKTYDISLNYDSYGLVIEVIITEN